MSHRGYLLAILFVQLLRADAGQALEEAGKLFETGDFAGVIAKLSPWAEKSPDSAEIQHGLGLAYYQQQNFPLAARHLAAAMKHEAGNSPEWRQTVEILGMSHYYTRNWREAAPLLAQAVTWSAGNSTLRYTLAMSYLYIHDRDNARAAFAALFGVSPDSPRALMLAADLMYQEEYADDAEALYRELEKIAPDSPELHFKLGLVAMTRRDFGGVVEQMQAELARNPVHSLAWQFLGDALSKLQKTDEAVDALQRATWLNGRSAKPFVMLAQIYADRGQFPIAESSLKHALDLEPQNYEANFLLARLYFKTNRADLAKKQMAIAERLRKPAPAK